MNTKINLTYKGVKYTLEYNRMTVKMIESEGFDFEKFSSQLMTMIGLAFKGAFYKNHRKVSQNLVDEIYSECKNKEKLMETISKMISECYETLTEEPSEGNAEWEVVSLSPQVETLE